jgi:FkbM family methyltransferase
MRSLARSIVRWLMPIGSVRRVVRGPARGARFVVAQGIGLSYLLGLDEAAPRFFERVVSRGMTVVDIGANKGQMALIFGQLVGPQGSVVSIEPVPAEFAHLRRNVRMNGMGWVEIVQAAAADEEALLPFSYSAADSTQGRLASLRANEAERQIFSVQAISLDDFFSSRAAPDFIKVDVEGAGAKALRGLRRIIATSGPSFYIELHGAEEQAAVKDELLSQGYVAETLDGRRVPDPTAGWFTPLWCYRPNSKDVSHHV